jgi:hypothetical protein
MLTTRRAARGFRPDIDQPLTFVTPACNARGEILSVKAVHLDPGRRDPMKLETYLLGAAIVCTAWTTGNPWT